MTSLIRCYESNRAIGQYSRILTAIKEELERNPPKDGEKTLEDYYDAFDLNIPQRMHVFSHFKPQDLHLLTPNPIKNTK
jgi:hypothetical protein